MRKYTISWTVRKFRDIHMLQRELGVEGVGISINYESDVDADEEMEQALREMERKGLLRLLPAKERRPVNVFPWACEKR